MKKYQHTIQRIGVFFFCLLFLPTIQFVYAAPPTSPYAPNETLDPTCGPTDTNCFVSRGDEGKTVFIVSSGSDQTSEITDAIDDGATDIVIVGTVTVSSSISVPSGTVIRGIGGTLSRSGSGALLVLDSETTVRDITLSGPDTGAFVSGSRAIEVIGTYDSYKSDIVLQNVTMHGFDGYGVFLEYVENVKVDKLYIYNIGYAGIGGFSVTNVIVDHSHIRDIAPGTSGNAYGVFFSRRGTTTSLVTYPRSQDSKVQNSTIEDIPLWEGLDTHAGDNISFINNTIRNVKRGIAFTSSHVPGDSDVDDYAPQRGTAIGNKIYGTGAGAGILVTGIQNGGGDTNPKEYARGFVISDNYIENGGTSQEGTTSGALFFSYTSGLNVSGNTLIGSYVFGINLYIHNENFSITGNTITDVGDDGAVNYNPAGIVLRSTYNKGVITGNSIHRALLVDRTYDVTYGVRSYANTGAGVLISNNKITSVSTEYYNIESGAFPQGQVGSASQFSGAGSPETVYAAPPGSVYLRNDDTTNTLYLKTSGTGNTGWVPVLFKTETVTLTDTASVQDINLTLGNDADVDTISGISIDVTSAATGDADVVYGLSIGNLSGADATVIERALRIGSGWDAAIEADGVLISLSELQALDGGISLDEVYDADSDKQINLSSSGLSINLSSTGDFVIEDSDTPFVTFADNGTVGIGVAPSYTLDVLSAATGQTANGRAFHVSTNGATFDTTSGVLSSYAGYFNAAGTRSAGSSNLTNAGIYATASGGQVNYAAYFETSSSYQVYMRSDTTRSGIYIDNNASNGDPVITYALSGSGIWTMGVDDSDSDKFKISTGTTVGSADKLVIDSTGLVGIGNTAPAVLLHVGDASVVDATNVLRLQDANSTCDFNANSGSPSCGSDETLKKDISSLDTADLLTRITALRPVSYRWLTDQEDAPLQHGFIAQEVAEAFPDLVSDGVWIDGSVKKFLNTGGLIPYLVGAVQELTARVSLIPILSNPTAAESINSFLESVATLGELIVQKVTTQELCIEDVCITRDQLEELLEEVNTPYVAPVVSEEISTETEEGESVPDGVLDDNEETDTSSIDEVQPEELDEGIEDMDQPSDTESEGEDAPTPEASSEGTE